MVLYRSPEYWGSAEILKAYIIQTNLSDHVDIVAIVAHGQLYSLWFLCIYLFDWKYQIVLVSEKPTVQAYSPLNA